MRTLRERLLSRRDIDSNGCWNWIGYLNNDGYGCINVTGKIRGVHRVSYEEFIGEIPDGYQIDHFVCSNRKCFNPEHLRPVTRRENNLRSDNNIASLNRSKEFCPRGHRYDYVLKGGRRWCKTCKNKANIEYKARKKQEK